MDELKILIETVANLPNLTVWVLVGFLSYKIVVVGSIYSVIRLLIEKTHNWLTKPTAFTFSDITVDARTMTTLCAELRRLSRPSNRNYITMSDVNDLRDAITKILEARK